MEPFTPAPGALPPTPGAVPISSSDRILAVFCHLAVFIQMYFVVPLIIFFVKRDDSPFVADHAKEVLNFHLSLLIYVICCIPLIFVVIGIPILIVGVLMLVGAFFWYVVRCILGIVYAFRREAYPRPDALLA